MYWLVGICISRAVKTIQTFFYTLPSDIDECLRDSSLCDHNCTNTVGSYDCVCDEGYKLMLGTGECKGKCHVLPQLPMRITCMNFAP